MELLHEIGCEEETERERAGLKRIRMVTPIEIMKITAFFKKDER
jgi:hypothetical protein